MTEEVLKCKNCGAKLADLLFKDTGLEIIDHTKSMQTQYQIINCPLCTNGGSFLSQRYDRTMTIGTFSDQYMLEVEDTDVNDSVILNKLKIVKL